MKEDISKLLIQLQELAQNEYGISNILQPGVIKEIMISDILNHKVIANKDLADAEDEFGNKYEYLCSLNRKNVKNNAGISFQIHNMSKKNLYRISRNKAFYFACFKDHLNIECIFEVPTEVVLNEVVRKLENSTKEMVHISFLKNWILKNGKIVYGSFTH